MPEASPAKQPINVVLRGKFAAYNLCFEFKPPQSIPKTTSHAVNGRFCDLATAGCVNLPLKIFNPLRKCSSPVNAALPNREIKPRFAL